MSEKEILCDENEIHESIINIVKKDMLDDNKFNRLSDFFKVFNDNTRLKILWALDISEMCVCDLSELLGMTKSAVSHQLSLLRQSRLVKYKKAGKNVFYSLDDSHIKQIIEQGITHLDE